jgi:hypothetical protein
MNLLVRALGLAVVSLSAARAADVDCVVSGWDNDSVCSVTCGGGYQKEMRTITTEAEGAGKACPTALTRQIECGKEACPQDCLVTPWTEWSTCSQSCGVGGTHLRTRQAAVTAAHGGKTCPDLQETEACNTHVCPDADKECVFSDWTAWDGCSKNCKGADNVLGMQMRKRSIEAEGIGNNACDRSALSETRTCGETPCVPVDCVFGAFGEWSTCSATCGTGTQHRTKVVVTHAKEGGVCNEEQAREEQPCNTDACPVEPDMNLLNAATLTNDGADDHMNKIVHADIDHVYSGGSRLYQLNKADLKVLGSYDPAPLTELTALAGDDEFLFVAGKGPNDVFQVHKVSKATLDKVSSYTVSVSSVAKGSVIAMQLGETRVFLSLAGNDAGAIVALNKSDMTQHGTVRELAAQANALALSGSELFVGTWAVPAWVYVLDTADLTVKQQRRLVSEHHGKLVSVAVDEHSVYFGTDASPSYIVHLTRGMKVQADMELDAEDGRCVSMTADWGYLQCGTTASSGAVLKVKKADLSLVKKLTLSAEQSVFYALTNDHNGNLFAPTWSVGQDASQVLKFSGFMSPTHCTVGPWSAFGDCVDFFTRAPLKCGQGTKIAQREVRQHAQWGGARCPTLIKTEVCSAKQAECCRGGSVFSKIRWSYDCQTGVSTQTEEATATCHCPEDRPMTIGAGNLQTCVETEKCHADTCAHVQCSFLDDGEHHKIKVTHNAKGNEEWNHVLDHKCSYSMARNGGCHCICWQPQCLSDDDCRDGTVCPINSGANAHCQPASGL